MKWWRYVAVRLLYLLHSVGQTINHTSESSCVLLSLGFDLLGACRVWSFYDQGSVFEKAALLLHWSGYEPLASPTNAGAIGSRAWLVCYIVYKIAEEQLTNEQFLGNSHRFNKGSRGKLHSQLLPDRTISGNRKLVLRHTVNNLIVT